MVEGEKWQRWEGWGKVIWRTGVRGNGGEKRVKEGWDNEGRERGKLRLFELEPTN